MSEAETGAGPSPLVLVVNPSLPVASVGDLVALAKAKPGDLNYGSGKYPTFEWGELTDEQNAAVTAQH